MATARSMDCSAPAQPSDKPVRTRRSFWIFLWTYTDWMLRSLVVYAVLATLVARIYLFERDIAYANIGTAVGIALSLLMLWTWIVVFGSHSLWARIVAVVVLAG